ncbi:class I SAM-dependent methyltransferase [Paenibacillus mendelii]|uniref:Class I SAM-dependent methyltransferase n=1 Tax=Paenibacillus mendelii TaxID=206163 RepID=A0ABV6JDU0_9BACL|nr:methyltransferase domain-containing protein [Paenibacillus mendelii]MCQ6563816.1 methyltransferase domain-containing protein [Paenibacillus mendelii]
MDKNTKINRLRWNEATSIHEKSDFYDVEGFKAGKSTLKSIELVELGDLEGKSILHLQCHFGLDSLSLARMGAKVTGVDLSDEAIELAKKLSNETGVHADFICADILQLPDVLDRQYDIVYTSYGVLCWISDLNLWGSIIAKYLKPEGIFFMVEGHPIGNILEYNTITQKFEVEYNYFFTDPILCRSNTTYGDRSVLMENEEFYQWDHSVGEILNSLIKNGLYILKFDEYPYSAYEKFEGKMIYENDGWWKIKDEVKIPLLFSVKATK